MMALLHQDGAMEYVLQSTFSLQWARTQSNKSRCTAALFNQHVEMRYQCARFDY